MGLFNALKKFIGVDFLYNSSVKSSDFEIECIQSFKCKKVSYCALSHNDNLMALAMNDEIFLYGSPGYQIRLMIGKKCPNISKLLFLTDTPYLVVAYTSNILFWNVDCGFIVFEHTFPFRVTNVDSVDKFRCVYVGLANGDIHLISVVDWAMKDFSFILSELNLNFEDRSTLCILESPICDYKFLIVQKGGFMGLYDMQKACFHRQASVGSQILCAIWDSNGKDVYLGLESGNLILWSFSKYCKKDFLSFDEPVRSLVGVRHNNHFLMAFLVANQLLVVDKENKVPMSYSHDSENLEYLMPAYIDTVFKGFYVVDTKGVLKYWDINYKMWITPPLPWRICGQTMQMGAYALLSSSFFEDLASTRNEYSLEFWPSPNSVVEGWNPGDDSCCKEVFIVVYSSNIVCFWSLNYWKLESIAEIHFPIKDYTGQITALSFCPISRLVFFATSLGDVLLFRFSPTESKDYVNVYTLEFLNKKQDDEKALDDKDVSVVSEDDRSDPTVKDTDDDQNLKPGQLLEAKESKSQLGDLDTYVSDNLDDDVGVIKRQLNKNPSFSEKNPSFSEKNPKDFISNHKKKENRTEFQETESGDGRGEERDEKALDEGSGFRESNWNNLKPYLDGSKVDYKRQKCGFQFTDHLKFGGCVGCLAWDGRRKSVAVGFEMGVVYLFCLGEEMERFELKKWFQFDCSVSRMMFESFGEEMGYFLMVGLENGKVYQWDLNAGSVLLRSYSRGRSSIILMESLNGHGIPTRWLEEGMEMKRKSADLVQVGVCDRVVKYVIVGAVNEIEILSVPVWKCVSKVATNTPISSYHIQCFDGGLEGVDSCLVGVDFSSKLFVWNLLELTLIDGNLTLSDCAKSAFSARDVLVSKEGTVIYHSEEGIEVINIFKGRGLQSGGGVLKIRGEDRSRVIDNESKKQASQFFGVTKNFFEDERDGRHLGSKNSGGGDSKSLPLMKKTKKGVGMLKSIVSENLSLLSQRSEKLKDIGEKTQKIADLSSDFLANSKKLGNLYK